MLLAHIYLCFTKRDGPFISSSVGGGFFHSQGRGYLLGIEDIVISALSEAPLKLAAFFQHSCHHEWEVTVLLLLLDGLCVVVFGSLAVLPVTTLCSIRLGLCPSEQVHIVVYGSQHDSHDKEGISKR